VTFLWFVTGATLVAALVAWRQARTALRRLEQLTQMYWELKYQQGEVRQELRRATGESAPAEPPVTRPTEVVIPLSSLKR
jgi:predicted NodU family carbamoyl transferase